MDPDYVRLISTPRKAIVLQEITPRLRDFIAQHKLPEPKRVVYRPLEFCEYKRCFVNVDKQVGKMGGAPIAGWLFWEIQNTALQTEAHCIWASPEGAWIDITPQHPTPRRLIFSADDRVADKRGYTVGCETPLTNNEKVLALQKFTRALARIRERHVNGFGSEVLIPMHLLWEAARNSDLPADVAGFLCQKYFVMGRIHGTKIPKIEQTPPVYQRHASQAFVWISPAA